MAREHALERGHGPRDRAQPPQHGSAEDLDAPPQVARVVALDGEELLPHGRVPGERPVAERDAVLAALDPDDLAALPQHDRTDAEQRGHPTTRGRDGGVGLDPDPRRGVDLPREELLAQPHEVLRRVRTP
jgi:hypothetical protein